MWYAAESALLRWVGGWVPALLACAALERCLWVPALLAVRLAPWRAPEHAWRRSWLGVCGACSARQCQALPPRLRAPLPPALQSMPMPAQPGCCAPSSCAFCLRGVACRLQRCVRQGVAPAVAGVVSAWELGGLPALLGLLREWLLHPGGGRRAADVPARIADPAGMLEELSDCLEAVGAPAQEPHQQQHEQQQAQQQQAEAEVPAGAGGTAGRGLGEGPGAAAAGGGERHLGLALALGAGSLGDEHLGLALALAYGSGGESHAAGLAGEQQQRQQQRQQQQQQQEEEGDGAAAHEASGWLEIPAQLEPASMLEDVGSGRGACSVPCAALAVALKLRAPHSFRRCHAS